MDSPLTRWYCDVCREPIEDTESGYVIWQANKQSQYYSFKIIHKTKCDQTNYNCSMALNDYTGEEGLARLLAELSSGSIIDGWSCHVVAFLDEYVELFRRVQTPYYEEARRYFREEMVRERLSGENPVSAYLPETLRQIIDIGQTP